MEKNIQPARFNGRIYRQVRHNTKNHNVDDAADVSIGHDKAAISRWCSTIYVSIPDSSFGETKPKKIKLDSEWKDSFCFQTEDKGKLDFAVKQDRTASTDSQKRNEDDFFSVHFKRDLLKTCSREVNSTVKSDAPQPKKCDSKRNRGPRCQRPLIMSAPELIEQYKINYAAQQLKDKPDTATKDMNDSTKYASKNSKRKGLLVSVASDAAGSQVTPNKNENTESTSAITEVVPRRTSLRLHLQNVSALAASLEGTTPSSDGGAGTPLSANLSSTKNSTKGRHSFPSSPVAMTASEGIPASAARSGHVGKHYRIFKSRAALVEKKPPVFREDLQWTHAPASSNEHLTSSESASNIQCVSEERSQKEGVMMAPLKFSGLKKSLQKSSDSTQKIVDSCSQKVVSHKTALKENEDSIVILKDSGKGSVLKQEMHWPAIQCDAHTALKRNKYHKEIGNPDMETLPSLTLGRAGRRFKEELLSAGGLDYIVDSVIVCEHSLPEDISKDIKNTLPVLKKLERYFRVLENISRMNSDKQKYLTSYKSAALVQSCTRTLKLCQTWMPSYRMLENMEENEALKCLPGYSILTCMLAVLRVLMNVTHENQLGKNLDLAVETSLMETTVQCLTTTHRFVPMEQKFWLVKLCLGLLISLIENRESSRQIMMSLQTNVMYTAESQPKTMSAIKAVVELFIWNEKEARHTAEFLNKSEETYDDDETSEDDETCEDDETFRRARRHIQCSMVASFAAHLLRCTVTDNKEYAAVVKKFIPNNQFGPGIKMLKNLLSGDS